MRALRVLSPLIAVALAGCAGGDGTEGTIEQALGGTAAISLKSSSARITHTSNTQWTLTKQGSVNAAARTVTWTVTATKGTTTAGQLLINGTMTVVNNGSGAATIGNVVVNLQTRVNHQWVSSSVDIADATQDDAATFARIVPSASSENRSTFTENAASGQLVFMDAKTNSVFSLVPQVVIPGGATRKLLFSATFNNTALQLNPGTPVRAEIIVTFGNAASNGNSGSNIDINGNGIIDPDEAKVRSVPTRLGLTVPAKVPSNATPTLTDALEDLETTGTVTFSNPVFNLGPSGGTVTVSFDGGASGGTITNCAHLRSETTTVNCGGHTFPTVYGINLTACDTQTIGPHACTPGTVGCGWEEGDLVTFTQVAWGTASSTAATLLSSRFFMIYPAGYVEIGIPGAGLSALFTAPSSITTYLPASGTLGPLTADLIDPSSTSSGAFGGEVLGLTLNVDYSAYTGGSSGLALGSLTLCGLSTVSLNGTTVSGFLALANTLLGGGANGYTINVLTPIAAELNNAFTGGSPSTWAQDHLVNGACP